MCPHRSYKASLLGIYMYVCVCVYMTNQFETHIFSEVFYELN